jgi:hypothetical protein
LEPFPFGSQTAVLEAGLSGLPVVPGYAPLTPLLVANDDALRDLLPNPPTEEEYRRSVNLLIEQPVQRVALGESLRRRLLRSHVGYGWMEQLRALYQQTDALTHGPRPIPPCANAETEHDITLSLWRAGVGAHAGSVAHEDVGDAILRHSALVARYAGNYASARRDACHFIRLKPHEWAAWRLLLVALLGRYARLIRRLLTSKARLVARVSPSRLNRTTALR